MMENEKNNIVTEFALSSEEKLRLTSQIVSSFDSLMEKLIKDFLIELKKELEKELRDGWEVCDELSKNPLGTNFFFITKNKWEKLYAIGFAPDNQKGRNIYIGVFRNEGTIDKPIKSGIITYELNEKFKKGKPANTWDWWTYVDETFRYWGNEDTLISLYHKTKIVEYFKSNLFRIMEIVEPIIDKEIKPFLK